MTGTSDNKTVNRRHSLAMDDSSEERHQGGGAATIMLDEETLLPATIQPSARVSAYGRRRRTGAMAAWRRIRPWLTWRTLMGVKVAALVTVMLLGSSSLSHRSAPAPHHTLQGADQPPRPLVSPDGLGSPGMWGRSYKLIQNGLSRLRETWERHASPGKVSVVGTMPTRCARPSTDPTASSPHFFLSGQHFDRIPLPKTGTLQPRGVVITASGTVPRLASGAYITAYLIRKILHSDLPIEVYYVSNREAFEPSLQAHLEALGNVRVLDLVGALHDKFGDAVAEAAATAAMAAKAAAGRDAEEGEDEHTDTVDADSQLHYLLPSIEQLASYAAKPYAVLASSFQENVLFDAGAIPFLDPVEFLDLEDYQGLGFTEFRDYVPSDPHKWNWIPEEFCVDTDAVVEYYEGTEGDSSCVLLDKSRNWDALLVTAILNGPLQHLTYKKLNGDKDTWVMAMQYTRGALPPLHTVPGLLMVDWEGNFLARKVHGQMQMLKVDNVEGETAPGVEEPVGLLVPLYFNNQLFNFSQWQYNKGWAYVGSYDDVGSLYNPPTSFATDCRPFPVQQLEPLTEVMEKSFDGVVAALKAINSTHCGCRDDWPTGCVTFIY